MAKDSKFTSDPDLAFLQYLDAKSLKLLANTMIEDSEGREQWTGELKATINKNKKKYETEDLAYTNSWKAIAAELQLFGGDTVTNFFRGKGVLYAQILENVADKVGADYHKEDTSIEQIEERILRTLFRRVTTLDDLDFIHNTLKEKGYLGLSSLSDKPVETIKNGAGSLISLGLARLNPIVGVASAAYMASGAAYRVTIPAVCIIAMLRQNYQSTYSKHNKF